MVQWIVYSLAIHKSFSAEPSSNNTPGGRHKVRKQTFKQRVRIIERLKYVIYLNSLNFRAHLIFAHLIIAHLIFAHLQKSQFHAHPIFAHCQKRVKEGVEKIRHNIHNIRSCILYNYRL